MRFRMIVGIVLTVLFAVAALPSTAQADNAARISPTWSAGIAHADSRPVECDVIYMPGIPGPNLNAYCAGAGNYQWIAWLECSGGLVLTYGPFRGPGNVSLRCPLRFGHPVDWGITLF